MIDKSNRRSTLTLLSIDISINNTIYKINISIKYIKKPSDFHTQ